MPMTLRIAFRNLREHKSKTLIVGVLLTLGVMILILGNAFMDTAAKGLEDTFTANFTGDVFVCAKSQDPISIFGVMSMSSDMKPTPIIYDFPRVKELVAAVPGVVLTTPQVSGTASIGLGGDWTEKGFSILFGVEPESYFAMFSNMRIVEGHMLQPGEQGVMISRKQADRLERRFRADPSIARNPRLFAEIRLDDLSDNPLMEVHSGDELQLEGYSSEGIKIRSATVVGIYEPANDTEAGDMFMYCDADTVRILQGLTLGREVAEAPSEEQLALLASVDDESLFGGDEEVVTAVTTTSIEMEARLAQERAEYSSAERVETVADSGAWNFLLVRTTGEAGAALAIGRLNAEFAARGMEMTASDWKAAAGPFAMSIDALRVVFNAAVIILAIVALIVMTNTLVISVLERTSEIGTMRALGARKTFVREMFFSESLALSSVSGVVGLALSALVIVVVNALAIPTDNPFFALLFGGATLSLSVNPISVATSVALVLFVAVVANTYPVVLALRIPPVRAMHSE